MQERDFNKENGNWNNSKLAYILIRRVQVLNIDMHVCVYEYECDALCSSHQVYQTSMNNLIVQERNNKK